MEKNKMSTEKRLAPLQLQEQFLDIVLENISAQIYFNARNLIRIFENDKDSIKELAHAFDVDPNLIESEDWEEIEDELLHNMEHHIYSELEWEFDAPNLAWKPHWHKPPDYRRPRAMMVMNKDPKDVDDEYKTLDIDTLR